jgi:hypothetical protein
MPILNVTATPVRIDPNRRRISVVIRQHSGDPVFYGFQQDVTGPADAARSGIPLLAGEVLILERDGGGVNHAQGPVWLVTGSGHSAEVFVQEQF